MVLSKSGAEAVQVAAWEKTQRHGVDLSFLGAALTHCSQAVGCREPQSRARGQAAGWQDRWLISCSRPPGVRKECLSAQVLRENSSSEAP